MRETADFYLFWVFVVIGVAGSVFIGQRWSECRQKDLVIHSQLEDIARAEARIDELQTSVSQLDSSNIAWERLIRERLDYVRPDEVVFEFKPREVREKAAE